MRFCFPSLTRARAAGRSTDTRVLLQEGARAVPKDHSRPAQADSGDQRCPGPGRLYARAGGAQVISDVVLSTIYCLLELLLVLSHE